MTLSEKKIKIDLLKINLANKEKEIKELAKDYKSYQKNKQKIFNLLNEYIDKCLEFDSLS